MGDELTPEQQRRLAVWRGVSEMARAQPNGQLTDDQVAKLRTLAEHLQELSVQLGRLAELGRESLALMRVSESHSASG